MMKQIWRTWKRGVHGINGAIAWTLMTITYVFAVSPVAVGLRLFKPDLLDRGKGDATATTFGKAITRPRQDVRRAQRPY